MIGARNAAWDGDRLVGLLRLLDDSEYIEIVSRRAKTLHFTSGLGSSVEDAADAAVQLHGDKKMTLHPSA